MNDIADKKRLRWAANALIEELRQSIRGTQARINQRFTVEPSETYGWLVVLGRLKNSSSRLELWLDRYTKSKERHFWFGFYSRKSENIRGLIRHSPEYLRPKLVLSKSNVEISDRHNWQLKQQLNRKEFNRPVYERYSTSHYYYYGQFDSSSMVSSDSARLVVRRAAAFLEEVLRAQPRTEKNDQDRNVYPRLENRKVVRLHISRERSSALAEYCKSRDRYRCQVCKMTFEDIYGSIGADFAEAHHLVPLSRLKKRTMSSPDDLITVCSNCHRMLHKLDGKRDDINKLKKLLRGRASHR
jgi:5-methylcytosine-specific restriction endonuclease McrA